jgi:hypothetical protein
MAYDSEHFRRPLDLLAHLILRHPDGAQRKRDVLFDREMRIERVTLEYHGDVARPRRQIGDDLAVDHDVAGGRLLQSSDQAHQGGLATARRTEQNQKLAFLRD